MKRREFVKMSVVSVPSIALAQSVQEQPKTKTVAPGADRLGEAHTLGFSSIAFKASPADTQGGLFIMEHSNLTKGGPYRHLHPSQDESRVEIGEKLTFKPGDPCSCQEKFRMCGHRLARRRESL